MASSSRSAIRVARAALRPALQQQQQIGAVRLYASSADVEPPAESSSSSSTFDASPQAVYVAPSAQRKGAEGAVMKKYTGPGFPKIPGLRHLVLPYHAHLHPGAPLRELTLPLRRNGGRNESGQVVNRGRGGGHRQRLRIVDFHRLEAGEHDVVRIEYDPGRTAHIALVKSRADSLNVGAELGAQLAERQAEEGVTGSGGSAAERRKSRNEVKGGWSYILAPEGLRAGDVVVSYRSGIPHGIVDGWDNLAPTSSSFPSPTATPGSTDPSAPQSVTEPSPESSTSRALGLLRTLTLKAGNVLPLYLIPAGTNIHNISMNATGKMQLCRSAGSYAQVVAHHGPGGEALGGAAILNMGGVAGPDGKITPKRGSVLVKLQSGEVRRLDPGCAATIGVVSNKEHHSTSLGKAGRSRWLGRRPTVRGVAMNACDHPHGGGRGKSKGNKHPRSVYGWLTKGKRTRRSKDKDGNKMVVSERPRGKASKK